MEQTIGGQRLGSGNRMTAHLHGYERSTHDLGYIWRSTMSAGTLVPFMSELALPGDTFDINLDADILTQPTIGPLFGSYKIQLDVFQVPIRLYQMQLHQNMLGIGKKMSQVKLPQITVVPLAYDNTKPVDNQQINPSCILSYLGIRGAGWTATLTAPTSRDFNAIPYLAYWDIYKNYYANKQEEIGAVIHANLTAASLSGASATLKYQASSYVIPVVTTQTAPPETATQVITMDIDSTMTVSATSGIVDGMDMGRFQLWHKNSAGAWSWVKATTVFAIQREDAGAQKIVFSQPIGKYTVNSYTWGAIFYDSAVSKQDSNIEVSVVTFPLSNIDDMRKNILGFNPAAAYKITASSAQPYGLPLAGYSTLHKYSQFSQEGLALKTYQSDLFNNWISTEWIDGADGVSEVTKIDTTSGGFTIDELNLSKKIYDMLNRVALSGGTYDDWLDVIYTHDRQRGFENPMYLGGLIKNLVFEEIISQTKTQDQPLGTLAGRGRIGSKHKGGKIVCKVDEPSYIIGIISLTPHVDYSQGNKWDVNLKTMDDLHKPGLDQIGFQDLVTDQMAWWDTVVTGSTPAFKSAGKQPAWINYMTNVNVVRGNFAEQSQMFMVLNRRYDPTISSTVGTSIKDLTTYVDPAKFNFIFADTRRDSQNFWAQVKCDITARRKMSAKIMPNL
ncbi:MAG: major capsid protein [Microviridae sp.]|nr:MAG: major capsid protein [Microviridae sp.]